MCPTSCDCFFVQEALAGAGWTQKTCKLTSLTHPWWCGYCPSLMCAYMLAKYVQSIELWVHTLVCFTQFHIDAHNQTHTQHHKDTNQAHYSIPYGQQECCENEFSCLELWAHLTKCLSESIIQNHISSDKWITWYFSGRTITIHVL